MDTIQIINGTVYNPLTGGCAQRSVSIRSDAIVEHVDNPDITVDASDCIVIPGLIDFHMHIFASCTDDGINPDIACLPNGVTTAVDGGSAGACNYDAFHKNVVVNSTVDVKGFLNVSSAGNATVRYPENIDPRFFPRERIAALFRKYQSEILGLKLRVSKEIAGEGNRQVLTESLRLAEEIGCPIVVHMTNPPIPCEEIAAMLRPGDVFCHVFQGRGDTILDSGGKVKDAIFKAQQRGVIMDACNGKNNFSTSVALAAMKQGFYPDIISSDLCDGTYYKHPVISLPYILSKYLAMGVSLPDVLKMAVLNPAKMLGKENELATLAAGTVADVSIFRLMPFEGRFTDVHGESIAGIQRMMPLMTIKKGVIQYRSIQLC